MAITKVTLRQKPISKGRQSLYLDYYPPIINPDTGKATRREFLKLYLLDKPRTPAERESNKATKKVAELIRDKRANVFNKSEIYTEYEKEIKRKLDNLDRNFIEYYTSQANKRKSSNHNVWSSSLKYFVKFKDEVVKKEITFRDLNKTLFDDYKRYLENIEVKSRNGKLAHNTIASYFNKMITVLKQAYSDDIISSELTKDIKRVQEKDTKKEFLTTEEVNALVKTPCSDELLRRISLFSILTGLRFSDIKKMVWSELEYTNGQGYHIRYTQKKSTNEEYLPIPEQAYMLTLGFKDPKSMPQNETVFAGVKYIQSYSRVLAKWVSDAGITKHITFHCFRHTYATLQLYAGTGLYTVSKMLGHKNISTTQIYAKIVDESKRTATGKIKLDI